jgi:hypothetical protein
VNFAGIELDASGNGADDRRLAGAVGPEERQQLSLPQRE